MSFKLKPYQEELLDKTKNLPAYACTFATGAGKTFTAIQSFNRNPTKNLLVITPNNVQSQWEEELKKHSIKPINTYYVGKKTIKTINKQLIEQRGKYNTIILNYEKIQRMTSLLEIIDDSWTIILDEAHRIGNWGTVSRDRRRRIRKNPEEYIDYNTTRSVVRLGELATYKILLTATPVEGDYGGYIGYFPLLKFMGYMNLSYDEFTDKYVRYNHINFGTSPYPIKVISGYRYTDKLEKELQKVFFGYTPKYGDYEPVHNKIYLERPKSYDKFEKDNNYKEIVVQSTPAKRVMRKYITGGLVKGQDLFGKEYEYLDNTIKRDWLKDFLQDVDGKVVIYYQYNMELKVLEDLMKSLKKNYIVVNGDTHDKSGLVRKGNWDVMLGQYQAASEGIDGLQYMTNLMVFYSLPESSRQYIQAKGRIDRMGQTRVPNYYYLIMRGTIDSQIMSLIKSKVKYTSATLDKFELEGTEGE